MALNVRLDLPPLYHMRQSTNVPAIVDFPAAVHAAFQEGGFAHSIRPGQRIVVTAGSRGIANISAIVRATVAAVKAAGASAVVLPTMGSHGGATPEGQREVLQTLGITEESVGASIISSLTVAEIGRTPEGIPVYQAEDALAADGIIVVGRVKPHTDFRGPIESGLMKMMVIGLGKHRGALTAHTYSRTYGLAHVIPAMARVVLANSKVLGGIAIMENAADETARIVGVPAAGLEERERALQHDAKDLLGRVPLASLDLLIIDEMGKNISGAGMDTNVIGRVPSFGGQPVPQNIDVRRVYCRGLTDETHGNATGVGLADFVSRRLAESIDWEFTYTNALTSGWLSAASLPVVCESDRQAVSWALVTGSATALATPRIAWIKNTLHLTHLWVTEPLLDEARALPNVTIIDGPRSWPFDDSGHLSDTHL